MSTWYFLGSGTWKKLGPRYGYEKKQGVKKSRVMHLAFDDPDFFAPWLSGSDPYFGPAFLKFQTLKNIRSTWLKLE